MIGDPGASRLTLADGPVPAFVQAASLRPAARVRERVLLAVEASAAQGQPEAQAPGRQPPQPCDRRRLAAVSGRVAIQSENVLASPAGVRTSPTLRRAGER